VDIAVAHLANPERAELLAANLRTRLSENLGDRQIMVGEVGAVLGAHAGPGLVGVVVAPR
jgi:fatty acid-binding protein DegV